SGQSFDKRSPTRDHKINIDNQQLTKKFTCEFFTCLISILSKSISSKSSKIGVFSKTGELSFFRGLACATDDSWSSIFLSTLTSVDLGLRKSSKCLRRGNKKPVHCK
uniref:Uncharacterized protein n=1 Tax=Romanomermis culicivorax TaxID=13658 RepID=A0A915IYZ5_ROMCU